MTTPTKEQIEYMQRYLSFLLGKEVAYQMAYNIIQEWENIRNIKRFRLEVGKTYIAKDGSEVKIIYKSPVRATGFLGIRATDGKTHPDDAIWYNPDGSHNEKYDGLTIISPK